jgi:hypothetical protein
MKTLFRFVLTLLAGLVMLPAREPADPPPDGPPKEKHRWARISFPAPQPWRKEVTMPRFEITNKGAEGMELTFLYYLPPDIWQEKNGKVKPESVTAQLYLNKEKPATIKGTTESMPYMGSGPQTEYRNHETTHVFNIPWTRNALDDAWIVLRFKGHNFWLELPYGFTRNPDDPPVNVKETRTDPVFPVSEKQIGRADLIVPWEFVTYQVEDAPANTGISLHLANPFDAAGEISMWGFEGDVREPRCSLVLIDGFGRENPGGCVTLALERDRMRRQMFHYARSGADCRHWGTVRLVIGEKAHTFTIPSSVFDYVQGHADVPRDATKLELPDKWTNHF